MDGDVDSMVDNESIESYKKQTIKQARKKAKKNGWER